MLEKFTTGTDWCSFPKCNLRKVVMLSSFLWLNPYDFPSTWSDLSLFSFSLKVYSVYAEVKKYMSVQINVAVHDEPGQIYPGQHIEQTLVPAAVNLGRFRPVGRSHEGHSYPAVLPKYILSQPSGGPLPSWRSPGTCQQGITRLVANYSSKNLPSGVVNTDLHFSFWRHRPCFIF